MIRQINCRNTGLMRCVNRAIFYKTTEPYNKRWQWDFKYAYYAYPKENEPTRVGKPEDSSSYDAPFASYCRDFANRLGPGINQFLERSNRCVSPFELYFLPLTAAFFFQFFPLNIGFKIMTIMPLTILWTRIREKIKDPKPEETYLREMLHSNEVISKLFSVETMQILDHSIEYTEGFPDEEEFPEFKNKIYS